MATPMGIFPTAQRSILFRFPKVQFSVSVTSLASVFSRKFSEFVQELGVGEVVPRRNYKKIILGATDESVSTVLRDTC